MDAWKLNSFRKMSAKEFTFDNGRSSARLAVSCINKFFISQDLDSRGGKIEATISIRKFSHHSPVVLSIWGELAIIDKLSHYFDSSLLEDEKRRTKMLQEDEIRRTKMLQVWEGELPKPSSDSKWAP
jgi:hypothetical protein